MKLRAHLATAALALLAAAPLTAQDSTTVAGRWQLTLQDGSYVWDIRLIGLQGDSLRLTQADTIAAVPVEQITEVRLIQGTEVDIGGPDAAGATMAALTGQSDEVFDLQTLDFAAKLEKIREILQTHPRAASGH
jgi:hypothetical protein